MNYFDDYYSDPQPQQERPSYIPPEPKLTKERKGLRRVVSVLLVLALVLGSCGATALLMNSYFQKEMKALTQQMNDKIAALEREPAATPSVGRPLASGEYLTPGQVYERNVNAVVALMVEVTDYDGYGRESVGYSAGTGFFISADGYLVTNYHVVEGGTKVTVTTHNDKEYDAKIIGYEANNDLALLKVEATDLPFVTLGKSSNLQVGDQVAAIGNVLSTFASSMTVGYVSGVDRVVDTEGIAMNMIQTDVAINSGNSGGPLFNMNGEVVGITTAKFSGNSSSGASIEGIGFAIPIDDVTGMIEDLQKYGYVTGAYLGVLVSDVDTNAQYYGLPAGAFVESVTDGLAAQRAGIQAQDIIIEVGGYAVTSVSDLTRVLRKFEAGETVSVVVYRAGQSKTITVTLDEKPREEKEAPAKETLQPELPIGHDFQDFYDYFRDFLG